MATEGDTDPALPFSRWWPFVAGALAGIISRVVFSGDAGGPYAAMTASFILLAPFAVGAVTVYAAERQFRRSWWYYGSAGALANLLFVIGTLLILIEGLLCAIIIAPLFALLGAIGGLLMGVVCRATNWPTPTVSCFVLLPLVLGGVDTDVSVPERTTTLERSVLVAARREVVWQELLNTGEIRAEEIDDAWLFRIGVPLPLEGAMREIPEGRMRRVRMGKNVYFDEVIDELRPNEYVRWTYQFYDDSFPPYALDEHVVIGGHYFDVEDTSYELASRGALTEVTMRLSYRVSTRFDWYAVPVARLLLGNLVESNLNYYRNRSEGRDPGTR
jgi:hypothetical protein